MLTTTRLVLHLTVLGAALVTAAFAPAGAASPTRVDVVTVTPAPVPFRVATVAAVRRHEAHAQPRRTRPRSVDRHRRSPAPAPKARTRSGPTGWGALDAAIARIPSYRPGAAQWVVSDRYGHWGTADWYHDTLYVSPSVPGSYLYDVAAHEWSHELSVLDYGGDVSTAVDQMNRYFGGTGLVGSERAADCMAILQGATWTHYTTCTQSHWRDGARRLLRGEQL